MYPKDTEKWKQFTTGFYDLHCRWRLFCIPKILKNESNSQPSLLSSVILKSCFVSQRYWKMKAIHNVVMDKDGKVLLFCIPKILKNESNSQQWRRRRFLELCCFVSQRYWKMKAIHNGRRWNKLSIIVVLYPKDTEKWKQFTTRLLDGLFRLELFCIPKILKNESNSQPTNEIPPFWLCCFVSQRYWKMKAIHNDLAPVHLKRLVVLYPKDTEKWKQFTTAICFFSIIKSLFCIPKILKNESNSQLLFQL